MYFIFIQVLNTILLFRLILTHLRLLFTWHVFYRFGSCQHYTGQTCDKYLDEGRLIYYEEIPSVVEHRLSGPFTVIQGHFSPPCKKYALPALCLTSFPYCESKLHPRPIRLCKEDCEKLYQGICNHDFNLAQRVAKKYPLLLKIMPDCSNLTAQTKEDDNCVKLGLSEGNYHCVKNKNLDRV